MYLINCNGERGNKMTEARYEELEIITLEMDDPENEGETLKIDCDIIGVFDAEYKGENIEYIAVSPIESQDSEEYEAWIFRYVEKPSESDDEEETYEILDIEDDEEYDAAVKEFDRLMDEISKE